MPARGQNGELRQQLQALIPLKRILRAIQIEIGKIKVTRLPSQGSFFRILLGNEAGLGAVARRNQPAAFEEALSVFGISVETGLGASRRFTI